MKQLGIVIVYFKEKEKTLKLLFQLKKLRKKRDFFVVLADNNSGDGIEDDIKPFTFVKFLPMHKNLGFAKAVNRSVRFCLLRKADYVLLLNPDLWLPENFLDILKNPADLTGPVIFFRRKNIMIYDFGGKINWRFGRVEHREQKEKKSPGNKPDFISGCCLLVKKKVWDKVGFFDERFFMYYEDVDFQVRAAKSGFKIKLNTEIFVKHDLKGVSGKKGKPFSNIFYNLKSNLFFILKYQRGLNLLFSLTYWLMLVCKVILNRVKI